jgi:hypothetical protein
MKTACLALLLVALCGCSSIRVQPIGLLSEYSTATVYPSWVAAPPADAREVSVERLLPLLANATWTSKRHIGKGGYRLRFPNGRELRLEIGFEFFTERGVPGTFLIRSQDVPEFRRAVEEIQKAAR